MHIRELISPAAIPPPPPLRPFCMNCLQVKGTLVRLCGKLELMVPSKRELDHAKPGTICLPVVNSVLMEHLHIKEATNMKVSTDICFIVLVIFVFSLRGLSPSRILHPLCVLSPSRLLSLPQPSQCLEKGENPREDRPIIVLLLAIIVLDLPVEPVLPPAAQDHPVGPPLNFSPSSAQNWVEDDQPMAIVEEEIPQDPPLEPLDSLLFSASDILEPPLTFGHPPLVDDLATDLGGCPIEEELPTEVQQEDDLETTWVVSLLRKNFPLKFNRKMWLSLQATLHHRQLLFLASPRTWCLSQEHLQLIFDMRRDVEEQLHRQTTLSRCLDVLFDALSSEPAKSRCPTCCQPFVFALRPTEDDGNSGSPKV
jgi:hypothetical protein